MAAQGGASRCVVADMLAGVEHHAQRRVQGVRQKEQPFQNRPALWVTGRRGHAPMSVGQPQKDCAGFKQAKTALDGKDDKRSIRRFAYDGTILPISVIPPDTIDAAGINHKRADLKRDTCVLC